MKKFEIVFMSGRYQECKNESMIIEGDFIEINGSTAKVHRFNEDAEPEEIAWFRDVVYWREAVAT